MALKLVNLLALLSVAALGVSFGPTPVNALQVAGHHVNPNHHVIAKKRRGTNGRCKKRPTSTLAASTTPEAAPTSTSTSTPQAAPTTTPAPPAPKPESTSVSVAAKTTQAAAPPPPPAAPAPPPSPPSTGGGSHDGKVGLAWPNGDSIDIKPWVSNHVKYIYTWGPDIPQEARDAGLVPIPMLWGGAWDKIDRFTKLVKPGYANIVAGFNEPNEPGQSNMTPEWAADLWKQHIEPLRNQGYKTICPVTSSNPNGLVWVDNFLKACNGGCTCDYMAAHYYDVSIDGFKKYVKNWCTHYNKNVFVTEFACQNFNGGAQCSDDEVKAFWRETIGWMKNESCVEGYFGFGSMHGMDNVNPANRLMGSNGAPNDFGAAYVNGY